MFSSKSCRLWSKFRHLYSKNVYRTVSSDSDVQYLKRGKNAIAYKVLQGKNPGVVWCPGFQSNMQGVKAHALEEYCRDKGLAFVRFDYQGCGQSGGDIREVTFSDWISDIRTVLDNLTAGPQILAGSSMGVWLMILVAMERQHRIHSLVGIASAPDFTQRAFQRFTDQAREELKVKGQTVIQSEWGDYVITNKFLEDIAQYNILDREDLPITCPVRLLHGMRDNYVPYETALLLSRKIRSEDVLILLRKRGDHRLSQPEDIQMLFEELDFLVKGSRDARVLAIKSWTSFSVYSHPEENV